MSLEDHKIHWFKEVDLCEEQQVLENYSNYR